MLTDEKIRSFFSPMPRIASERLILRPLKRSDYSDMFEYSKREEVTKYLLWRPHTDSGYTYDYLRYVEKKYRENDFFDWALELKDSGKMIGTCGFNYFDKNNNSAVIGYVINPAYWNKGYATEAVSMVIRLGFIELDLNRIEARHMIGNDSSGRVMEKCGMSHEGILRSAIYVNGEYKTVSVYSILYRDYIRSQLNTGEGQNGR